jgi:predicted RND superfamily exporter protein
VVNCSGTSNLGRLTALSVVCTMVATVFFQPALMDAPKTRVAPALRSGEPNPGVLQT